MEHVRERVVLAALQRELASLDPETLTALRRGLQREDRELAAGSWGRLDDSEGCLLSLAAWELGLASGADLMYRSIAAVRIPVLFDELSLLVLERTGDTREARRVTHRLVSMAAADGCLPPDAEPRRTRVLIAST